MRLEITVPAETTPTTLAWLRTRLARVTERRIPVSIEVERPAAG